MSTIVLQIEKDGHVLSSKYIEGLKITKQNIERSVLEQTGLTYEQYEVFYTDAENDLIMTVVEEDYSIAEMALESDTIVFHIDVKVEEDKIKFRRNQSEMEEEHKDEEEDESLSFNSSEQEKVQQVYKSAISSQNPQEIQRNAEEKEEPKQSQPAQQSPNQIRVQITQQEKIRQESKQQKMLQQSKQNPAIKEAHSQDQQNNQKNDEENIQYIVPNEEVEKPREQKQFQRLLSQPEFLDLVFQKICQKLPTVLKPECFLEKNQIKEELKHTEKDSSCHVCKQKIIKIPFYINQRNQHVCQSCEVTYQTNEVLLKVRSQASRAELIAVKYVTLSKSELSNPDQLFFEKETETTLRQKRIAELFAQKISLEGSR